MEDKSVSQSSELTEQIHRRRLSSILKAPRSPLKDLASGNERCQENAIEKQWKSSRRVSFAETIRVFTPELQSTGSANKENEGFGTSDSCNSIIKGASNQSEIAGMDTLLHGHIQVPGHNADWAYVDTAKDRTIAFSSDNDMDMTASNTVNIYGLIEEKTKKIDTRQFLASLKSQNTEEGAKNKDGQLSFSDDKNTDFKFSKDSSTEHKIKFSDFLARLESRKSKDCLVDAEKENLFPFAPHFHTQDNTGNVTQMFRAQDDGLDFTKCHTTNIESLVPTFNTQIPSHLISTADHGNISNPETSEKMSANDPKSATSEKTILFACEQDDMELTKSHTIAIDGKQLQELSKKDFTFTKDSSTEHKIKFSDFLARLESKKSKATDCLDDAGKGNVFSFAPHFQTRDNTGNVTQMFRAQDDGLDFTKCHTTNIESLVPTFNTEIPSHLISTADHGNISNPETSEKTILFACEQDDMELTKSHTIAIDGKQLQELSKKDNRSYSVGLKLTSVSNKTILFSTDTDDMELTRSHTVCIDQKALNRVDKNNLSGFEQGSASVSTSGRQVEKIDMVFSDQIEKKNATLLSKVTDATSSKLKSMVNATNPLSDDMEMTVVETDSFKKSPLSGASDGNKTVLFTCDQQDMEITRSHTILIDRKVLCERLKSNTHNTTNRKNLDFNSTFAKCPDEILLQDCNMETSVNVHLTESLFNKSSFDKTLCKQSDMEMTTSHTVAIENETFEAAQMTDPQVSRTMTSRDRSNTYACKEMDGTRSQVASNGAHGDSVPLLVSKPISCKDLSMPPVPKYTMADQESELANLKGNCTFALRNKDLRLNSDEILFPNEEQCMDLTKAHTVAVEVNVLDGYHVPSTSLGGIKGDTEVVGSVKTSGELIEVEQNNDLNEPMEKLQTSRRKSNARSLSLPEKSSILKDLQNELSQIHTIPVDVSLRTNAGSKGNAGPFLILEESENISIGVLDHKSKETEHTSFRNATDRKRNPISEDYSGFSSDCKVESFVEFNSQLLGVKSESLKMTSELTPVNCSLIRESSDSRENVRPEDQKDCVLNKETLTSAHHQDPEMALETDLKKSKFKGKRVSFHFSEKEIVVKNIMLDHVTEPFSVSPQEKDGTLHVADQISDFKLESVNQVSVGGELQNTEKLEDNPLHKDPNLISHMNADFPEGVSAIELSPKSRKRRSIADIQLKIKSLTHKAKISPHQTAPVSSLIVQLPATSQILYPSGSGPDKVLLNAELPNAEITQEIEPNEKPKTITRENCLPNRFSVKVFQPKLPNKRASSTRNVPEPVLSSVSGAQPQNDQSSKALFKTLNVYDGPCIDEEMLPACPDDPDISSVFHYEVPEGAWEELNKEGLQQNLTMPTSEPKDSMNGQKRVWDTEDDLETQRDKRARWNEEIVGKNEAQTSMTFKGTDKSYRSDDSTHHACKTMEQTYYSSSSSSQDSRGDGMSVELSSQQYSQMSSQLACDTGCEKSLWQKFQDGTVTVQEFFVLLRIHILIQKPRYSELPSKVMSEDLTAAEILLDRYVYYPNLQVYEEEGHALYQVLEELKASTELQHKPLVQVNRSLWEALQMCSKNELMYFAVKLKNMKSLFYKKSKLLAHEEKVSTYSKLLHTAQTQCKQLHARLSETDDLLRQLDDGISSLEIETSKLNEECRDENLPVKVQGCTQLQAEIDRLQLQEQHCIKESAELEAKKQKFLGQTGCLQEEARVIENKIESSFTEWQLVKWTDKDGAFTFLYESLDLSISFGDYIDGESFNNQQCRRISSVTVESQMDDELAAPSSVLVHKLISQYIEKKGPFHETYKTQNNVPQLLFDLSLVVSRCRLLGEELEYLMKWGAIYNVLKAQVQDQEVRLVFSSLAALLKFELIIQLSEAYPTVPLAITVNNIIGSVADRTVTEILSNVPVGLWYLKRIVKSIHEHLLV
ncbi:outer kinetochore KNL1 complex subunit KNL1 isoform X2 [Rhinoderma darwinii]|uniref:outer kinetochore KNL1 complex subunit KNL1 isoform X2 n=1 Tax=Rhinoderma darwinii TaxID=43563 RepID=UPI003F66E524